DRAEARVVPVRQGTRLRRGGEVRSQPLLLRRAGAHVDGAVEHDHVPRPEVVAVIAFGGIARGRPEVAEVARGARGLILLVAGRGSGARPVPPPRRPVTLREIGGRPVIDDVAPG